MSFWKRLFGRQGSGPAPGVPAAEGQGGEIRDAGPEAMRDPPNGWSKTDEEDDESFPASDPPGITETPARSIFLQGSDLPWRRTGSLIS